MCKIARHQRCRLVSITGGLKLEEACIGAYPQVLDYHMHVKLRIRVSVSCSFAMRTLIGYACKE
jgi:hypothetical protein